MLPRRLSWCSRCNGYLVWRLRLPGYPTLTLPSPAFTTLQSTAFPWTLRFFASHNIKVIQLPFPGCLLHTTRRTPTLRSPPYTTFRLPASQTLRLPAFHDVTVTYLSRRYSTVTCLSSRYGYSPLTTLRLPAFHDITVTRLSRRYGDLPLTTALLIQHVTVTRLALPGCLNSSSMPYTKVLGIWSCRDAAFCTCLYIHIRISLANFTFSRSSYSPSNCNSSHADSP